MKVLVTGASGFIGSHIADELLLKGLEVRCIVRKTSDQRWLKEKPFELIEASLSDFSSLEHAVKDVDIIIHSAGLTAAKNYEGFLRGNRDGTRNLLEAAKAYAPNLTRFLHVSSLAAVGPSKSLEEPVTEESPFHPITSYGKSKHAAELELVKFKDIFPITVIRPPAVFGPRDTASFDIFKTVQMGLCPLIGFNPKYVSIINSTDLVDGIIKATFSEIAINQTYFIANKDFFNWDTLNKVIADSIGKKRCFKVKLPHSVVLTIAGISGFLGYFSSKPPVFNYEKGIDFIQNYWICSVEKAKNELQFQSKLSLEEGFQMTAKWYIENGWLK